MRLLGRRAATRDDAMRVGRVGARRALHALRAAVVADLDVGRRDAVGGVGEHEVLGRHIALGDAAGVACCQRRQQLPHGGARVGLGQRPALHDDRVRVAAAHELQHGDDEVVRVEHVDEADDAVGAGIAKLGQDVELQPWILADMASVEPSPPRGVVVELPPAAARHAGLAHDLERHELARLSPCAGCDKAGAAACGGRRRCANVADGHDAKRARLQHAADAVDAPIGGRGEEDGRDVAARGVLDAHEGLEACGSSTDTTSTTMRARHPHVLAARNGAAVNGVRRRVGVL
mmetsp:Transcript_25312/g.88341  ORF Transcript_25312/g.88341 Transcript_25312/m.88341 type:complete len:290 (+) Transcript_25312:638-1507(+)